MTHIRTRVFRCKTQREFAEMLGTTQASVSRWETAERFPSAIQKLVREKAQELGRWDDRWLFSPPASARGVGDSSCLRGYRGKESN